MTIDIHAIVGADFDTKKEAESASGSPIPAGWYRVIVDSAEVKQTRDQTGYYAQIRFDVIEGQYERRVVFARLNLQNKNPTAQEIGRRQWAQLCEAVGAGNVQYASQIAGRQLEIQVTVRPARGEYPADNDVRGFRAAKNTGAPAWSAPQQQNAAQQAAASTHAPQQSQQNSPPPWAPPAGQAPGETPPPAQAAPQKPW